MNIPLKLDITTGDKITPKEVVYEFKLLLEDRSIQVLPYNLETVMAEKLETVISRGDQNTRPRDFYDIYILYELQRKNIKHSALKAAFLATAEKRNSKGIVEQYDKIVSIIQSSELMKKRWRDYQKDFNYANEIEFEDTCNAIKELLDALDIIRL